MSPFPAFRSPALRSLMTSTALASATLIAAGVFKIAAAQNLPTGGSVASGNVTINQPTANRLVINQYSGSAITNWQTFSIGQGNSVNVVQPSTSSAMLARVTGNTTSTIAGSLTATGQLMLVNPNGISITSSGTVNAGAGFVATSLGISDQDYLAGKRTFTGNGASADVTNVGTITVGPGGYAALIGGTVANSGTISVPMGRAGLGSGEVATLDFSGDGFLQVGVPTHALGSGALVSNSGKILAKGGNVEIRAAQARDAARQAINMSGVVEARSVTGRNGDITLDGGDGAVAVSGKLDVSSRRGRGGGITITGRALALTGAKLNASGKTGGGTIRIGGDRQGRGTLAHAATTTIDAATTIRADATGNGNGGTVVVWSDTATSFAGTILARGGSVGGDGGSAEVSSHGVLAYTGATILTAPHGASGTLLLDPYNVTISDSPDSGTAIAGAGGITTAGQTSSINIATLKSALGSANVTITTGAANSTGADAGNITLSSASNAILAWSAGTTLSLTAANNIAINSAITFGGTNGAGLSLNAGNTLAINAPITVKGAGSVSLVDNAASPTNLTFANGAGLTFANSDGSTATSSQGGALTINGQAYTLLYSMADVTSVDTLSLGGTYALAGNLDASGPTYTDALIGSDDSHSFTGTFEGLGHTISNLTIAKNGNYAGLFGYSSGTIRDIGLIGGSVSGSGGFIGDLAGVQAGVISNVYATGAVSGSVFVGGLVGYEQAGTIVNAFAGGAVNGQSSVGGLVGYADGTIVNAAAAGAVNGSGSDIGGLVGQNDAGTIVSAIATGAVSGRSNVGGLAGLTYSGTVSHSYWDISTTGQSSSSGKTVLTGAGGGTGLGTAQLQDGTTAFLGGAFTVSSGFYPYLNSFFPNGVQAISGTAYQNAGTTAAASGSNGAVTVTAFANGERFGQATTGANGYYYILGSAGSFTTGNGLLAYTAANSGTGATNSATLATATGPAPQSGLDLYGNTLTVSTSATALSAVPTAGSVTGDDATAASVLNAVAVKRYNASGASFTIDETVDATGGFYVQTTAANAPITVAKAITIENGGNLTLDASGALAVNAPIVAEGAAAVSLTYNIASPLNLTFANGTGLTFANSDGTTATSSQGGALSINGQAYTLLYSMADVANVNSGLGGAYALAGNLDASGPTYGFALIASQSNNSFTGTFEGLGHAISNLTVNSHGAGLFGFSSGSIRDLGLIGGSVSGGNNYVGDLLGYQSGGTVSNVYATGAVSGSYYVGGLVGYENGGEIINASASGVVNGDGYVGGLVGSLHNGTIVNVSATGAVNGGSFGSVGGLVGVSAASILNASASGAVNSSGGNVGGLVGQQTSGTISNVYATGAVNGGANVGGLIGTMYNGAINNGYWDTQTTGQSASSGSGTGLTTAQLQNTTTSLLGSAFTVSAGLYPYITSLFPTGVQAISGTAYKDAGATAAPSGPNGAVTVTAFANGARFGQATTGANGYYYILGAAGSFATGNSLLAYTAADPATGATNAAAFATAAASANQSSLNVYGNALTISTAATTLSSAPAFSAAVAATGNDATATSVVNAIAGRGIIAEGASFTIDQTVDTTGAFFVQTTAANAPITVAQAITIENGGSLGLNASGALTINAPIQVNGAGAVSLTYNTASPTNLTFANGTGLTFAQSNGAAATSSQGGALAINGQAYTLLYAMANLANVNSGLGGAYALAGNLDASGTTYADALIGSDSNHEFTGTFEGLGHTISNLTISKSGDDAGLVGYSGGTIRDIGLVGGSVRGGNYVGSLVGTQDGGVISNVYATGTVSGSYDVGGLVGTSWGEITNASASGWVNGGNLVGGLIGSLTRGVINVQLVNGIAINVSATGAVTGSGSDVGGLVGLLSSTLLNATASGAVTGGGSYVGGLVGQHAGGTISNVFATGAVNGGGSVGGLVGYNENGAINNGYWDTQTSGQSTSDGGGSGLTTAQLQDGTSASGLGSAFAVSGGLYPYLTSFFPNGVQAISGTAYRDGGTTVLASGANGAGSVNVRAGAGAVETVTTGANGYYYAVFANGTIDATNGTNVLAYTIASDTGAANGTAFATAATGTVGGLNIYGGWRRDTTSLGTLSSLNSGYASSIAGTAAAGFGLANRSISSTAAFAVDTALSASGELDLSAASGVTQSAAISAGSLVLAGSANASFTLVNSSNHFTQLRASGGAIDIFDAANLTLGTISGSGPSAAVQITTDGDLTIASGASVSGALPVLAASGAFVNDAGSNAVVATSGRWLIYSANPAGDTFGGLDSGNSAVWNTAADGTVTATGNRYVFAYQPILTVTANDAGKTYGDVSSLNGATITGAQAGVAGAYLGDTLADIVSGTAAVTSTGTVATAAVNTYAITAAQGSLTSSAGYGFGFVNGTLTVGTRAITVTADAKTQVYGNATPTLTYSVGGLGLVNNDTLSGALATTATATSNVGNYAITQNTLAASSNYALTYI
ncbi:MAG: MBG domain-containing protein, partial [Beijerinckiaceae bacterium]|nr:MBG domain-containing protein [Beijerinckiaceae bacterium]